MGGAQGTCPECNTENFTYFGDVLTVAGPRDEQSTKCKECKSNLTFKANTRMVRLALLPHFVSVQLTPSCSAVLPRKRPTALARDDMLLSRFPRSSAIS